MKNHRLVAGALLAATALTFAAPATAQRVDRIVAFGDSYADDGNFFQLVGMTPPAPYSTGRFSGGTNYIDTLGELLAVPIDNFAIGGALTNQFNTNTGPSLGFPTEYTSFLAGGGPAAFPRVSGTFDANDLLAVSIGGNDARIYQTGNAALGVPVGTLAGAPAAATASAAFATTGLNALVNAGAQNISFLAGNTAILPEIASNPAAQAIRNAYSTTFNSAIQTTLAGYAANGVMVHYLDLSMVGQQIIADPAAYGLSGVACPALPDTSCITNTTLANSRLFYFDQLHLTSAGFAIVARYIATQLTGPLTLQATSDLALDTARQFGRTLTTRMDVGAPRDGDMPEGLGAYIAGDHGARKVGATDRNDQFNTNSTGVTIGAEYGFGSGVVGIAGNYSRPKADFGNDSARTKSKSIQLGLYAAAGIAGGFVEGYAGYGWDDHDISRRGVVAGMEADADGKHTLAGAKAGYLAPFGSLRVGPVVALDYARAKVDGYTEEGDPALTLSVDSTSYKSLRGSIGAEVRGDFAGDGVQLRPYGAAVVEKDFTGDGRVFTFAQTSAPGVVNSWEVEDGSKDAYGRFTAGMSAAILSNVSLDIAGSTTAWKDQGNETSVHLGFRTAF